MTPLSDSSFSARMRRSWRRSPRRLRITREGRAYLGFTIAVGIAAINTGNNLLYLILGLLLAGVVLSGVLSELCIRHLSAVRRLPTEVRAGRPSWVEIDLSGGVAPFVSFAVEVRDVTDRGVAGKVFTMRLAPGEVCPLGYRWTPERRGLVRFTRLEIVTRYPFGLFEKWRDLDLEEERVVFPRAVNAAEAGVQGADRAGEDRRRRTPGPGDDFRGLRDARADDDARSIHWPSTARRGSAVVIEREQEPRARVMIVVDHRGELSPEALDALAEKASAHATRACKEGGAFALVTCDERIPFGTGTGHLRRVLGVLALMGPARYPVAPQPERAARTVRVSVGEGATERAS